MPLSVWDVGSRSFRSLAALSRSLTCAAHPAVQMWSDFPAAHLIYARGASVYHVQAERREAGRERRKRRHVLSSGHVRDESPSLCRSLSLCASSADQIARLALCRRLRGHIRRQKAKPGPPRCVLWSAELSRAELRGVVLFEM